MQKGKMVVIAAWGLSILVFLLAFIAWGQDQKWQFGSMTAYDLFPLFGLIAFSLMWTHYVVSVVRHHLKVDKKRLAGYLAVTSFIVLISILLHPGLFIWQLWRDGFGFPPQSYLQVYTEPALRGALALGTVSLLVFLSYELYRIFRKYSWWRFVAYASDIAMLAIFYHGLQLGGQLQGGWYRLLWFFYGITLVAALIYTYVTRLRSSQPEKVGYTKNVKKGEA